MDGILRQKILETEDTSFDKVLINIKVPITDIVGRKADSL